MNPKDESELNRLPNQGEVFVFGEENFEGQTQQITTDIANLNQFFPVKSMRMGPKMGVTVFSEANYQGLAQELTAELPSFVESRLQGQQPKSLKIWSAIGRPFSGYWAIQVAEGRYLSVRPDSDNFGVLTTSPTISEREGFHISYLGDAGPGRRIVSLHVRGAPFAVPYPPTREKNKISKREKIKASKANKSKKANDRQTLLIQHLEKVILVEKPEAGLRKFSLFTEGGQWIYYDSVHNDFLRSTDAQAAAIFCRSIKLAKDETQIGELLQGEAALYENPAYWGKAWIFHTFYADFSSIAGLNDAISSIQLGPLTGATIYREAQFKATDPKAGKQDIIFNIPSLKKEQVREDQISSIDLWQIKEPASLGVTFECRLSQDFRGSSKTFEEYSAYRTILRLPPTVETVEVWATDRTQIEVEDQKYDVDEDISVTLKPNLVHRLMITTDAIVPSEEGKLRGTLSAPGLKIRTNTMQPHERFLIFPDQEVHERLANLQTGELWNAEYKHKDGSLKPLIDQTSVQQDDVTNAQEWIKKMMSTVKYSQDDLGSWKQAVSPEELQGKAWALDFSPRIAAAAMPAYGPGVGVKMRAAPQSLRPAVNFREMSQMDVQALLAMAKSPDMGLAQWWFFDNIVQVVKDAVNVVIAKVNEVVTVIIKTGQEIFKWVVETAQKAVAFVEAIFEKIGVFVENIVNWLKYVFNWDDILRTRDYLRKSFEDSLDYLCQTLVPSAKESITRCFNTQKENLLAEIGQVIARLGGMPEKDSPVPTSTPNSIFDTIDWVLSKIMSGAQEGLNFVVESAGMGDFGVPADEGDQELRKFCEGTLTTKLGSAFVLPGNATDVITTLVRYPDRPLLAVAALLNIFESLAVNFIEIGQDIILGLLDLVPILIGKIRKLLTDNIRIPFISDICEWIKKTGLLERIGNPHLLDWMGDGTLGFSLLDAVTLILAVPFTAIYKAFVHQAPFKDVPYQNPFQNVPSLAQGVSDVVSSVFTIMGYVSSAINGFISAAVDFVPKVQGKDDPPWKKICGRFGLAFAGFSWLSSLQSLVTEAADWLQIWLFSIESCLLGINGMSVMEKPHLGVAPLSDEEATKTTIAGGVVHFLVFLWKSIRDQEDFFKKMLPGALSILPEPLNFLKLYPANPYARVALVAADLGAAGAAIASIPIYLSEPGS